MEITQGLGAIPRSGGPLYLALGMFDGVHLGHQAVLARTREAAAAAGGRHLVLTFDPHPQRVIAPPPEPILLTTIEERLELFAARQMHGAVVVRFDDALRQTPAGPGPGGGGGGGPYAGLPHGEPGRSPGQDPPRQGDLRRLGPPGWAQRARGRERRYPADLWPGRAPRGGLPAGF